MACYEIDAIENDIALVHDSINEVFGEQEMQHLLPADHRGYPVHQPLRAKLTYPRWSIKPQQLRQLEEIFKEVKMPSIALRQALAEQMGVKPRQIQVWFRNRRQRVRLNKLKDGKDDSGTDDSKSEDGTDAVSHSGEMILHTKAQPASGLPGVPAVVLPEVDAVVDMEEGADSVLEQLAAVHDPTKKRPGSPVSECISDVSASFSDAPSAASAASTVPHSTSTLDLIESELSSSLRTAPPDLSEQARTAAAALEAWQQRSAAIAERLRDATRYAADLTHELQQCTPAQSLAHQQAMAMVPAVAAAAAAASTFNPNAAQPAKPSPPALAPAPSAPAPALSANDQLRRAMASYGASAQSVYRTTSAESFAAMHGLHVPAVTPATMAPSGVNYAQLVAAMHGSMAAAPTSAPPPTSTSFVPVGNQGRPVAFSPHELNAMGALLSERERTSRMVANQQANHQALASLYGAKYDLPPYEQRPPAHGYPNARMAPYGAPPRDPRDPYGYFHYYGGATPAPPQEISHPRPSMASKPAHTEMDMAPAAAEPATDSELMTLLDSLRSTAE